MCFLDHCITFFLRFGCLQKPIIFRSKFTTGFAYLIIYVKEVKLRIKPIHCLQDSRLSFLRKHIARIYEMCLKV